MLITRDQIQQVYRLLLGREAIDATLAYWLPDGRACAIAPRKFVSRLLDVEEDRLGDGTSVVQALATDDKAGLVGRAEALVARLGPPAEAINELGIDAWHHSFTLSDGTRVTGGKTPEVLAREFEAIFGPIDMQGRSVLDIGAWNGAFSFEAMRRGAARVLAVDLYTWIDPPFRRPEPFLYVRKDPGSRSGAYSGLDAPDVSKAPFGKFRVVPFLAA